MILTAPSLARPVGRRVAPFRTARVLALAVLASTAAPSRADDAPQDPRDWPNWRGPQQISASLETGLPETWNPRGGEGGNLLWKRSDLGTRSTPVVMRGKLYVLVRDKPGTETEGEKVVCVDAATGEQIWQHRFNVYLTDTPDTRVGWSSVVGDPATGRVYAQGVCGYFCCLDGDSGKVVWDHSLQEEYGVITTYGGRTNVPVVFEDLVLISAVVVGWGDTPEYDNLARPSHRFMAFDKATGEIRWLAGTTISPPDTTYSTPTVAVIDGEAQLIFGGADGQVWSLQPRTGKVLWHFPLSKHGLNSSPLVIGDTVYMANGWENLVGTFKGSVVALDAKLRGDLTGKEKWITYNILASKSSPIMVDGKLWVIDDGAKLFILDPETGEQVASRIAIGSRMSGSPLHADGKVYVGAESGQWAILRPTDDGAEFVHKLRLNREEINGSPIVSHGRIYLPTSNALYCIGKKDAESA
ncbi:MAG TPA: PQQ-binding-like beta-propeller repeat protein, partial [Lacipirellulaceae bacterium]|nr:PQQ-binding-like beta-propeller repeat protein [Lacipirellulaceae bacterium]